MGEHDTSYQATHTILSGARIKVHTKNNHGFAWCTVISPEFDAQELPREQEPHREPSMRLFLAMSAFSVCFPQHGGNTARYEAETQLYAFSRPQDKTVIRIPKTRLANRRK